MSNPTYRLSLDPAYLDAVHNPPAFHEPMRPRSPRSSRASSSSSRLFLDDLRQLDRLASGLSEE